MIHTDTTQLESGESERVIHTESTQLERGESERMIHTEPTQLERGGSERVIHTDTTQLESGESERMIHTDTTQLERGESERMIHIEPKELERGESERVIHTESTQLERGESERVIHTDTTQLERKECERVIHTEPTQLERGESSLRDGTTEPRTNRSTDIIWSTDTQEKQRRYLVLDLPDAQEIIAEKPAALLIEVQDPVDQPKGQQTELTKPTQLEKAESRNIIHTDTSQLEKGESRNMIQTGTTQLEEGRPGTPETLRLPSETAGDRTTEFRESQIVEGTVPVHTQAKGSTLKQAKVPEPERQHGETPKAVHPETREAAAQDNGEVKEEVENERPPHISTAQAEPELCSSDTATELTEDRESRNLESLKSAQQSKEDGLMKLPTHQKVPEDKASEAGDMRRSEKPLPLELPHGLTMQETFTEIQQLVETGPNSFVIGAMALGGPAGDLDTSHRDLETRLSHVVLRILSCRNRPAQLNTTAMTQQVEEAEDCRQCTQEHVAKFSRMCEDLARDSETAQHMEGQWSAALWDASAAVHAKEAQFQLVTQYHRQTLAAKATLEKLTAKLEALGTVPVESSSHEAEKLRAVLRDLGQERTVIGELLQTYFKLSPHLSQADSVMAHIQLEHLQDEWRALERAVEKMLHHVSVHIQETRGLFQEAQELHSQLETLQKSVGPPQPSAERWDSKRAGQLMVLGSSLTAANQHYLHLQQQTSDALSQTSQGGKERKDIEQALQSVKEQLENLQGQISLQSPSSSNATLGKIMKVMQDAFTWAKQTESDIEAKKKVALLPEGVHSQIKGLKKLQSEISAKQSQLESLLEEVKELEPELDKQDLPMVHSSLKTLQGLSKSTAEKLAQALHEMESGLQAREKMSEQIVDVDSWVVAHVHKETIREPNRKGSTADLERKLRQLKETLKEADKQAAVTEALLMRSRDISPELSIAENRLLNDKLIYLQEDIKSIISHERTNCRELEELLQAQDSSLKKLDKVEKCLRQISVDLNKFRFPITNDTLCEAEPVKHMILEQKCQVDQLRHCKKEKRRELLCAIAEMQNKVSALGQKAEQHKRYLSCRQHMEDLKENVEKQVLKIKDEGIGKEERFKNCQALLIQFPLIKSVCQGAVVELENISTDLLPSQMSSERHRLRQATDSFSTWEMTVHNDTKILEWVLLKSLDYPTEHKAMVEFLTQANRELEQPSLVVGLEEQAIDRELLKCVTLQKNVESRARVLEALQHRNGARPKEWEQNNAVLADLRRKTLKGCEMRMESLTQVQGMLRDYSTAVRRAVRFLQEVESRLLLPLDCVESCPEELQHTQQALVSLDEESQSYITQIQALVPQHPCVSSYQAEQLHNTVLSQLLVRVSTLQAQAQVRMETLQRCAKKQSVYRKCHKEISQRLKIVEATLSDCITLNATSYKACLDQQEKLKALVWEVDSLAGSLEELREWCPERGCSGSREEAVSALWRVWARLQCCAHYLKARSDRRGAEWRDITKSVERATIVLDQLQDELPDCSREKASLEELQDLLVYTEQYQDRLDCEHRALTALELRVARLLGIPAHQEQSPPIPLCQELQTMQDRYKNLKEKSMLGRQVVQSEVQERERVKEEIGGVKEWLVAAVSLLSVMEDLPSTQDLQEVQTQLVSQKAVLQGIMDSLRMKYSDMYTLVPVEIDGPLQEVTRSLQEVEEKMGEAVEKSGPLCRLGGRVEEIRVGLQSVVTLLEQRSPTAAEAESRQKHIWDELDLWHSRMAALEVEVHDIAEEHPEEAHILTDKLMEPLQLYQQVAKQAEQRTTFLSRINICIQEHDEMINSSNSWLSEAQVWLTEPCTYTTAKCLSSHASALQMVLDDSAQMRRTLQGFVVVLQEVCSVCNMSALEEQLAQADQRVANMQQSIAGQLSQFQHAAAEVDAIETEVEKMEKNLNKFRDILSSHDSTPLSPEEHHRNMQMILGDIEMMKRIMAEIENCKPGLGLPEESEETLTVFKKAEHLQQQVQALEQRIKEQSPTLKPAVGQSVEMGEPSTSPSEEVTVPSTSPSEEVTVPSTSPSEEVTVLSTSPSVIVPRATLSIPGEFQTVDLGELPTSPSEEVVVPSPTLSIPGELQENDTEEGHIRIVHVEEDVLRKSGASLMTVEESSPAQRQTWVSERDKQDPDEIFIGESQAEVSAGTVERSLGKDEVFEANPESAAEDVASLSLSDEGSTTEALSKPVATVTTQALPQSMVNKSPSVNISQTSPKPQQKCTIS